MKQLKVQNAGVSQSKGILREQSDPVWQYVIALSIDSRTATQQARHPGRQVAKGT